MSANAMATFGKIDEYQETEEWNNYVERLNHYFEANDIKSKDKQKSIFLATVGAKTYKLIRNLVAPNQPKDKSYGDLTKLVQEFYKPKPSVIVQRFKFNTRKQQEGESIPKFVAELRNLSEYCEFGPTLDEMLRDQIVVGTSNQKIQKRLLAEHNLTLKKALDLALAIETAEMNAESLHKGSKGEETSHQADINKFSGNPRIHRKPAPNNNNKQCSHCDGAHESNTCYHRNATCYSCGKKGHVARVCRSKGEFSKPKPQGTHRIEEETEDEEEDTESYSFYSMKNGRAQPYKVDVVLNDKPLQMELDTGASLSIISQKIYESLWERGNRPKLKDTNIVLQTYTGEKIEPKGMVEVMVSHGKQSMKLPLHVVDGKGPALLGRDWLQKIQLDWPKIKHLSQDKELDNIINRYTQLFEEELGTLKGKKAKIHVDPDTKPEFFKARPVPYTLREKIEQELERLTQAGTIEPVQYSDWATPIVPVVKDDGTIRICGDYKLTVNKASTLDAYPVPKIDDLYTKLAGGESFTELDLSHAYEQMLLDDDSKQYVTINTHQGLFRYNRLPYGVSSAPGIFQRTMDNLLQGIPFVGVFLDNILITGRTEEEHLKNIDATLKRLSEAGLRLKAKKCHFMKPSLECLGHRIDAEGFHPVEAKVKAVKDAPVPKNVSELKSFLGMINFYGKFLPNLSSTLEPLHVLLRQNHAWKWGKEQQNAFITAKGLLQSSRLLVHYDPTKELVLSCDASPYGLGAVLAQVMENGSEKPVSYASRTLSKAEKNYSQLDKEALAVVFAVKKFHQFLYGRHFKIYTDHKPLLGLLSSHKAIPPMASGRVQRWALTLSAYEYDLVYRPGKENGNADALSRLPLPVEPKTTPIPAEIINLMETINNTPVDATKIKQWTTRDPLLSRVLKYVQYGWPGHVDDDELKPYFTRRNELSLHAGCLLWGSRVLVPPRGREEILKVLHENHLGISRMKSLARNYVWWPKLDEALEKTAKGCETCQAHQKNPVKAPLHPWQWPARPWSRIHIDYAGPFMGSMFLLIIDAHSKWLDIYIVNSPTTASTVEKLRMSFATHGLPEMIVSDNGAVFTSQDFSVFAERNGIKHVTSAPYHPATNGLVERAVQTFKQGMKKQHNGSLQTKLSRFLFSYRNTPQTTTGETPTWLRWGRGMRSHLDLLQPSTAAKVERAQEKQIEQHDKHARARALVEDDEVLVRNYSGLPKWLPGTIIKDTGPVSSKVELDDGTIARKHHDQLLPREVTPKLALERQEESEAGQVTDPITDPVGSTSTSTMERRYPTRERRPPERFHYQF